MGSIWSRPVTKVSFLPIRIGSDKTLVTIVHRTARIVLGPARMSSEQCGLILFGPSIPGLKHVIIIQMQHLKCLKGL